MNQVTKIEEPSLPGIPEDNTLLAIISRASRDPDVDVDKLERLMAMSERLEAKRAEALFDDAMASAQEEMTPVRTDAANKSTSSRYASFAALDRAIRPTYTKHGFSISYDTGDAPGPDTLRVLAYVAHRGGHRRTYKIDMPADGKGAKGGDVMTRTHATGSAFSYGKRYLEGGIFNIVISDDDGNAASADNTPITEEDMEWIKDMIEQSHSDLEKFCRIVMKVDALSEITKKDMPRAREALNEALSYWQRKNPKAKQ